MKISYISYLGKRDLFIQSSFGRLQSNSSRQGFDGHIAIRTFETWRTKKAFPRTLTQVQTRNEEESAKKRVEKWKSRFFCFAPVRWRRFSRELNGCGDSRACTRIQKRTRERKRGVPRSRYINGETLTDEWSHSIYVAKSSLWHENSISSIRRGRL